MKSLAAKIHRHAATLLACLCLSHQVTAMAENNIDFSIAGVKDKAIEHNITQRLTIFDQHEHRSLSAAAIEHLTMQGITEIKAAMMPYGYMNPQVHYTLKQNDTEQWLAQYNINPGPRLIIKESTVTVQGDGQHDQAYQHYLSTQAPQEGQYFSSMAYEDAKKNLLSYAFEHGYLDAKLTQHSIQIDRKQNNCVITLSIDTGARYRFGAVSFQGSHLSQSMLQRYPSFKQNQPYNEQDLRKLQLDLMGSDYFSNVRVDPKKTEAKDHQVPTVVTLSPSQKRHYQVGIGYGTDTGIRGLATLHMNQLNARGHTFKLSLRGSKRQEHIEAKYTIPGYHPATQHYALSTISKRDDDNSGTSHVRSVGVSYNQLWKEMHLTSNLNYQLSTNRQQDESDTYREKLLIPSLHLSWTHSNHPTQPTRGHKIDLLVQGSSEHAGSTITFFQSIIHGKRLQPLSKNNNQSLMLRASLGYTASHDQDSLPLDYLFYVGGSQSIRGYDYQAFGPGPDYIDGSIEFRQRLWNDLYGTAFMDAGNTGNTIRMKLHRSAGVGLLYRTLVGSFHLSYARPLEKNDRSYAISFSMGPEL